MILLSLIDIPTKKPHTRLVLGARFSDAGDRTRYAIFSSKKMCAGDGRDLHFPHRRKCVPVTGLDLHFVPEGQNEGAARSSPRRRRSSAPQLDGFSSAHDAKKQIPGSGICFFGAGDRTRTGTPSLAADFESATSTISSHRQVCLFSIVHFCQKCKEKFCLENQVIFTYHSLKSR